MAEEMRLDLEELKHLESIAKRPRVLSLLSSEIRILDSRDMENNQLSSNQSDQSTRDMLLAIQQILEMQCRQTTILQKNVEMLQSTTMTAMDRIRGPTTQHIGTMSDFILLSPPVFTGTEGPLAADEWMSTLEMLLEALKVPKEEMVSMARMQLRGVALHWWSVEKEEFKECVSWDVFKERFLDQFFPKTFRHELENEFIDLKQEGRTVEEYTTEFIRLSKFAPFMVSTEAKKVNWFEQGLDRELQIQMVLYPCTTFSSVVDMARRHEMVMNQETNKQGVRKRPSKPTPKAHGLGMAKRRPLVTCRFCGQNGHLQRDCWRAEDHQVIQSPHSRYQRRSASVYET